MNITPFWYCEGSDEESNNENEEEKDGKPG